MPRATATHATEMRQRILDGAHRAMLDGGYRGTTMPKIAAEAGVSVGLLYRYFSSKEELYLAMCEAVTQAQLDALPPVPTNVVAAAHRRIVERILDQVDVARARVREGTYGLCAHCNATIHQRVLELEPWQTACPACDTSAR